jgi:hypothetical protein
MPIKLTVRETLIGIVALVAIASALYGYYNPITKQVKGDDMYYPVEVPKPYKVISKQTVTVEKITVLVKTEIKEKYPSWFTDDPRQQLTAVGLIEPYKGYTECASVINLASGNSSIIAKKLPVPLFGFENKVRVGGIFGLGTELHANWTFGRVGSFYIAGGVSGIISGVNKATAIGILIDKEFE